MRNQYKLLAEKYQLEVYDKGDVLDRDALVKKLAVFVYTQVSEGGTGAVPAIIKTLVGALQNMVPPDEIEQVYSDIIEMVGRMSIKHDKGQTAQKITDMARIMKAGLGVNKPGLN